MIVPDGVKHSSLLLKCLGTPKKVQNVKSWNKIKTYRTDETKKRQPNIERCIYTFHFEMCVFIIIVNLGPENTLECEIRVWCFLSGQNKHAVCKNALRNLTRLAMQSRNLLALALQKCVESYFLKK
jgi:hypothetical protein